MRWRGRGGRRAFGPQACELHARSTVLVVHPELPRTSGDHILSVGRPDWRRDVDALTPGEDARPRAVSVRDPDVLRAVAIADERDLLAIRRVARLLVVAHPTRDARGRPPGN